MKANEARKLIGKYVEWEEHTRVSIIYRTGWLEDVKGKNVQISGDWLWLPDIKDFKVLNEKNNNFHS